MPRKVADALRWLMPLALTAILALLLAHTSRQGEILARYSRQYTYLLLATALLAAVAWWIAADRTRWDRFLGRVWRARVSRVACRRSGAAGAAGHLR